MISLFLFFRNNIRHDFFLKAFKLLFNFGNGILFELFYCFSYRNLFDFDCLSNAPLKLMKKVQVCICPLQSNLLAFWLNYEEKRMCLGYFDSVGQFRVVHAFKYGYRYMWRKVQSGIFLNYG